MPQDKRRSISYRSFVTCDNPKGVIECGVIRKSKINSQKKEQQSFKVDNVAEKKVIINTPLVVNKEICIQEITGELDVSKSGDKMNHVINSWSRGKGNVEDNVGKDLLRGALDLQESLVMLGRLQEDAFSRLGMSRTRRKEKSKVEEGRFECMVNSVPTEKLQMGFQRPRKSTDVMKKAVRDSLLRQNVITNPIFEESFDHRMMGCSYMASTSSSQSSSMVRSSNFVPSDSSSSSIISQRRKKKESNLIVRLMGLDSPPLSPRWHIEGDKIVSLPKLVYEVDSPRARKSRVGAQVSGEKQRSVEEILENLHFKGLLRGSSVSGTTLNLVESDVFALKNGVCGERPPIVIMKPLSYKTRDLDETIVPGVWLKENTKPTCSRLPVERIVSSLGAHFSEDDRKSEKRDAFSRVKESVTCDQKSQTKHETPRKSGVVEKVSPSRRKGEENNDEKFREKSRFHDQEKLASAPKLIKEKDGRNILKQQNVNSTTTVERRKQENCEISRQRRKNRHSALVEENIKGKGKEKVIEVVYGEDASNCDDSNVLPVTKSVIFDSFRGQNQSRNQIRDCTAETSFDHRLNDKTPVCDIALADTREQYNAYDDNHSYSEITSVSTSEHYSPVCEVTLVTTHENGVPVNALGNKSPSLPYKSEPESSKEQHHETPRTSLQTLLLSNPSFLNNLEKLFNIQAFPNSAPYDVGKDAVLIDYANEVLQLKSSEFSQPYAQKKRTMPSLHQLLEEIRNDIECLKRYHGSSKDDNFSSDHLYLLLDRDLSFKNGMWQIGWKTMFSQDDLERVIREVDKFVVGKLIEEIVLDLMVL